MHIIKVVHENDKSLEHNSLLECLEDFDSIRFADEIYEDASRIANLTHQHLTVESTARNQPSDKLVLKFNTSSETQKGRDTRLITCASEYMRARLRAHFSNTELISLDTAKAKYNQTQSLAVGLYTRHPRNSRALTRLANFHANLAMEKDDEMIMLLGRMGAKSIEIIDSTSNSRALEGDIKGGSKILSGNIATRYSGTAGQGKHLKATFKGKPVDIPSDLLSSSVWFSDDSRLLSIYESRKDTGNTLQTYSLVNTYADTFDFDFELAARFLKFGSDLKAEYKNISTQVRVFQVEFA